MSAVTSCPSCRRKWATTTRPRPWTAGPRGWISTTPWLRLWGAGLRPGGWIAVEIGYDQGEQVNDIFAASGAQDIRVVQDLAGRDRVVVGRVGEAED